MWLAPGELTHKEAPHRQAWTNPQEEPSASASASASAPPPPPRSKAPNQKSDEAHKKHVNQLRASLGLDTRRREEIHAVLSKWQMNEITWTELEATEWSTFPQMTREDAETLLQSSPNTTLIFSRDPGGTDENTFKASLKKKDSEDIFHFELKRNPDPGFLTLGDFIAKHIINTENPPTIVLAASRDATPEAAPPRVYPKPKHLLTLLPPKPLHLVTLEQMNPATFAAIPTYEDHNRAANYPESQRFENCRPSTDSMFRYRNGWETNAAKMKPNTYAVSGPGSPIHPTPYFNNFMSMAAEIVGYSDGADTPPGAIIQLNGGQQGEDYVMSNPNSESIHTITHTNEDQTKISLNVEMNKLAIPNDPKGRTVLHFRVTGWEDGAAIPLDLLNSLREHIEMRTRDEIQKSPVQGSKPQAPTFIVHCKGGIGRTGEYIGSMPEMIQEFLDSDTELPKTFVGYLEYLRELRSSFVQTIEQANVILEAFNPIHEKWQRETRQLTEA